MIFVRMKTSTYQKCSGKFDKKMKMKNSEVMYYGLRTQPESNLSIKYIQV